MRVSQHLVRPLAGQEGAMGVGIGSRKVVRDGINYPLRHLRAAGRVEINRGLAVYFLPERWKLLTHPFHVKLGKYCGLCTGTHLTTPYRVDKVRQHAVGSGLRSGIPFADEQLTKDISFETNRQRSSAHGVERIAPLDSLGRDGCNDISIILPFGLAKQLDDLVIL